MERDRFGDVSEDDRTHQQHLRQMVDYYANTAQRYNDWHCDPGNDDSHNYAVREVLKAMESNGARTLLDVACGTGRATGAALDRGYEATGLDVSPAMLDIAHRELSIPRERLVCGDATELPFGAESFDVSCILGALHHCAQPEKIIAEMIRVTRKAIIVSDIGNRFSGGIKQTLVRLGLFRPVYWIMFRRPPRTHRRTRISETDGPTFNFSIEEIVPELKAHFRHLRCLAFYKLGQRQICSFRFPRLFAWHAVVVASTKC